MELSSPIDEAAGTPCVITIAGPNGIGKSRFYTEALKHLGWPYINADALAKAFWEDHLTEEAGRPERDMTSAKMTDKLRDLMISDTELINQCHSFVSETVFSSKRKADFLARAKAAGHRVVLIVIGTDNPNVLLARVAGRKEEGGHDVDPNEIRKRFDKVFSNAAYALQFVDEVRLVDNTDADTPFVEVAKVIDGKRTDIVSPLPQWAMTVLGDTPA
jgi:predicted ABC-type ATPase